VRLAATIAVAALAVCVSAASGATLAGRIVFAANDAPSSFGHIYVSHGHALHDLSTHSAGLDVRPAVSPDGSHIAFWSYRGGRTAVYVMRIDGSHTTRVSPLFAGGGFNGDTEVQSIVWRPDSRLFAVLVYRRTGSGTVYSAGPSGGWRVLVSARRKPTSLSGYTADGALLLYVARERGSVDGVDASGRTRFEAPGDSVTASRRGSIAVQYDPETWTLYSAGGRKLTVLPNVAAGVWSPNGALLATMSATGDLRVRSGSGRIVTSARFSSAQLLGWLGNRTLRLEGPTRVFGLSATTGKRVSIPAAYRQFAVVSSGTRAAALQYPRSFTPGHSVRLVLGTTGGAARDVAVFPVCADDAPVSDLQLFGSDGLAYDSACPGAQADIYSVAPNGSDLQKLTTSPYDDAQPAVSPDGTMIAFVRKDNEVHCGGCTETLWVMNADGSGARSFPNSPSPDVPYDDQPSFSPDGKTILFVRSGPNTTGLFTVPTAGGPARDLHLSGTGAVWGPSLVAYNAWPSGNLATVAPNGTAKTPVKGVQGDGRAAWSPDGRLAYLQTDRLGRFFITLPATGKRISLPQFTGYGFSGLVWSPDGSRFAFVATDDSGISDVWTVQVDGTHLTRLTHGLGAVTSLAWR
jgi:Tol biopolymer transport system component